jgi:hypothetical protein
MPAWKGGPRLTPPPVWTFLHFLQWVPARARGAGPAAVQILCPFRSPRVRAGGGVLTVVVFAEHCLPARARGGRGWSVIHFGDFGIPYAARVRARWGD